MTRLLIREHFNTVARFPSLIPCQLGPCSRTLQTFFDAILDHAYASASAVLVIQDLACSNLRSRIVFQSPPTLTTS
jgi:hypothetical protein